MNTDIPIQLGEKVLANLKTKDDLDTALANLRQLEISNLRLSHFERELLTYAIDGLGT
jgi:hypothetical protein